MKLNKFISMIYVLTALLFTNLSCKKMLDLKPSDQLDERDIFTSTKRLESAVLGVYADWYPEYSIRIGSIMADECRLSPQNAGVSSAGQNLFRWRFSSADEEILNPWKNAYQVINRVNRLLNGLSQVPVKSNDDQEKLNQLKGELLAIRAYEHFDLYRIYGASGGYNTTALAIPYVKKSDNNIQPGRLTTEKFFLPFWEDMKDAEALLANVRLDNNRMGLLATFCLHARAALYTKNYADAQKYATKVIDQVPLAPANVFDQIWKDKSNEEVVFKLKRTNVSEIRPGDLFYNISAERILFTPSLSLMSLYDKERDVRYKSYFENQPDSAVNGKSTERIIKYQGTENALNRADVKIFRTAEMYLIRAEAALKNQNLNAAENDLNKLRAARIADYKPETFSNTTTLSEAIAEERLKELVYEGHRYFDLKRLEKPISRSSLDVENDFLTLLVNDKHYLMPIPQAEVMANPNVRPNNPGW